VVGSVRRVLDRLAAAASSGRRTAKLWVRQYRRARVANRKIRSRQVYALSATFVLLAGLFVWSLAYLAPKPHGVLVTLDQLGAMANHRRIATVTFRDEDAQLVGTYTCPGETAATAPSKTPASGPAASTSGSQPFSSAQAPLPLCPAVVSGQPPTVQSFWTSYPRSDAATAVLLQLTADSGARVRVNPQTRKGEIRVVTTLVLPLMLLANLFVLLFVGGKKSSSGIGEVETFGSIGKGRFGRKKQSPVTFASIAGADEAVEELKEVRDYLADPDRYKEIGALPPKGVLLIGPPGCGKTLLAKAVAGEVGVPFFSVAGAEFVESLVGVGAARVRDLFARVRAVAPAVVFIDELDAAGRKRGHGGGGGGSEEREQTLNQMLVEMDGFDVSAGIVVMAATNRPDILDPALLRPGRFDRHVTIDRPDLVGRGKILELHARGKPFAPGVDFHYIARRTPGFSGADLANVVNESALLAMRQTKAEIDTPELEEAIQRTLMGTGRKGRMLSPDERKRAAYHESGHVIVSAATGRFDDIHRVSILARGRALGTATTNRADAEALILSRSQLISRLVTHLAGRAAETLVFGEPSTGAEDDLILATGLTRDIVARFGMSEKVGALRFLALDSDGFLDGDVPFAPMSGTTQQEIEAEMRRLVEDAEREAIRVLITHREVLDSLAERLEIEETLEGPDLEAVLAAVRPEMEMFGGMLDPAEEPVDVSAAPRM
jgi:cell division protease FtsH